MSSALHASLETLHLDGEDSSKKSFIVGLDYGTTFSAGAFCLRSNSNVLLQSGKIQPFIGYSSEFNETKNRNTEVPSVVHYKDKEVSGIGLSNDLSSTENSISKAKLGLDNRPETAPARATLLKDMRRLIPGKKVPADVISDYLAALFGIFKQQLIQVGYDPRDSIELNCAIPSIWTHRARRSMVDAIKTAATKAGLDFDSGIRLWPEAEAATEHVLSERPNLKLKEGDVFVVCDAGGGTVDFTTYSVQDPDPLCLKEVIEASGALCGSTFLDQGFLELVETRAHACRTLTQNRSELSIQKQIKGATREFRTTIKPNFAGGLANGAHSVPFAGLPEDEENGFFEDDMIIKSEELLPIFERVAAEMWTHLRSQLRRARHGGHHAKYVIFTGGLSQSPFMRNYPINKLAEESTTLARSNRIQPVYAETVDYSVAAGAIRCSLKAGKDTRTRRINSTSIGIPYSERYNKLLPRHNEKGVQRTQNEMDKQYYVKNVVSWVLTKGQEQPAKKIIRLFDNIPADAADTFDICIPLYACDHVCEDPHAVGYYREKSHECYIWEEVTFTIDMSIIKDRIQPQVAKARRQRRPKAAYRPLVPSRRSARLNEKFALEGQDSLQPIGVDVCTGDADASGKSHEFGSQQHLLHECNQVLEEEEDDSKKYFLINYSFSVEFDGLLAKYEFWCEDARVFKTGRVSLPCYELGG